MAINKTAVQGKESLDTVKFSNVKTKDGTKEFIVTKDKIIEFHESSVAREKKASFSLVKDNNGQYRSCETEIGQDNLSYNNMDAIVNNMDNYVAGLAIGNKEVRKEAGGFVSRNPDYVNNLKNCQSSI